MLKVDVQDKETFSYLRALRFRARERLEQAVQRMRASVAQAAQSVFSTGMKGFRPRVDGVMRREGLRFSNTHRKNKRLFRTFFTAWHPLVNIHENWKRRPQVRILSRISRVMRKEGFLGGIV